MTTNKRLNYHPILEANQCIYNLTRNNTSLACLHNIDMLITEEVGLANFELYSTIELVS